MHFPQRIYGIENEFGVIGEYPSGAQTDILFDDEDGIGYITLEPMEHSVIASLPMPRVWHSNGSCTYLDSGLHPEHATAECASIHDVVRFNKAGEILSSRMFERKTPYGLKFLLFKNNMGCDEQGNIFGEFGCHENYYLHGSLCIDVMDPTAMIKFQPLIPFLITRQIFDGAGWWDTSGNLHLSQRAHGMSKEFGHGSTHDRSLVQTRIGDTGSTSRMHLICGDANILEFAIYLKMGTTALVLALFEANRCPGLVCMNSIEALKFISRSADPNLPTLKIQNERMFSALETQFLFLNAVRQELPGATFANDEIEAEVKRIVYYWDAALNAIEKHDEEWMRGRFDYATKQYLIERQCARLGITDESKKFLLRKNFDIFYHGIYDRTLQERMNKMWNKRRIVTDAEISNAMLNPPINTRARMRGMFVRACTDKNTHAIPYIDWKGVGKAGPPYTRFLFDDPFAYDAPDFESFISCYNYNV
ncbi:MAG: proteasome accessory factor PafA2 family protein [bacterium]|nr:proteasome accessory factor PafA2 family protein [bacterium]